MKKKDPNEYDPNNPWEGDKLDRQSVGIYLTDLVSSIEQPFVIALKSEFGTGKTDFLQRWQRHLNKSEEKGFKALYFNAWETDYASEPLVALISNIIPNLTTKSNDLLDALDSMVMYTLRAGISGVTDLIDPTGTLKQIAHSGSKDKRDEKKYGLFKRRMEEFKATENAINQFRKALSNYLNDQKKSKLIILIDELDRCRPNYAIEVLECIKHLFNIPGIIFVIAVDNDQLQNAVSSVYGTKLDGDGYLRKFFDWQLKLPKPSAEQYSRYLIEKFDLSKYFKSNPNLSGFIYADFNSLDAFIQVFSAFSEICGLSLRKQEQCFTTLDLILRAKKSHEPIISSYLGFLLAISAYINTEDKFERFCLNKTKETDDSFILGKTHEKSVFFDPVNVSKINQIFDPNKLKYSSFRDFVFKDLNQINKIVGEMRQATFERSTKQEQDKAQYKLALSISIQGVLKDADLNTSIAEHLYKKIEKSSIIIDDKQK